MPSPLADLDELILACRDARAKSFLAEAVGSYKAGALRAAIVATWIAVCFDIIDKLRELSLSGDKEAERQVEELEKTRKSGDITKALKFERNLLELARDRFELISHLEYVDLERLQADRNRCAHPSLVSEEQAYSPSAELVRAHIHAAVSHLLQHPPAQGKYALERMSKEVQSEYFPTDVDAAVVALMSGPFRKPRHSLIRNFVLMLLKRLIQEGVEGKSQVQAAVALRAAIKIHPVQSSATIREKLSPLFRTVEDSNLKRCTAFLEKVPDTWQYLEADVRQRLTNFVEELPLEALDSLDFLLVFEPLREAAEKRVSLASRSDLKDIFFFDLPTKVADRMIEIFLQARSFDQANELAKKLAIYATDLSPDHVRSLIIGAQKNQQVLYSLELGGLLSALRKRKKIPEAEFDALLVANGLDAFAPPDPQDG